MYPKKADEKSAKRKMKKTENFILETMKPN